MSLRSHVAATNRSAEESKGTSLLLWTHVPWLTLESPCPVAGSFREYMENFAR